MDNPIQLEIIKNALNRIGEEMAIAIIRAAYFTFIKEMADMSCAIFDYEARLVAQSGAPLLHLSSLRPSLRELMKDFPPEQMKEGDVYLFNDPFRGGIHSNDIMVIRPVFYKGQLTFFTCALIHVSDLGGVSAGGLPANATECYHEGLMLPPVKLYDGGQLSHDLVKIIRANSRTPDKVMGDINAMAGGNNFAARKMTELLNKHGRDKLLHYVNQLIEYTERRTRQEIEKDPGRNLPGRVRRRRRWSRARQDLQSQGHGNYRRLHLPCRFHRHRPAGARTDQRSLLTVHLGCDYRFALHHRSQHPYE